MMYLCPHVSSPHRSPPLFHTCEVNCTLMCCTLTNCWHHKPSYTIFMEIDKNHPHILTPNTQISLGLLGHLKKIVDFIPLSCTSQGGSGTFRHILIYTLWHPLFGLWCPPTFSEVWCVCHPVFFIMLSWVSKPKSDTHHCWRHWTCSTSLILLDLFAILFKLMRKVAVWMSVDDIHVDGRWYEKTHAASGQGELWTSQLLSLTEPVSFYCICLGNTYYTFMAMATIEWVSGKMKPI